MIKKETVINVADSETTEVHYHNLDNEYYILVPISKSYEEELYQRNIYDDWGIRPCFKYMLFNEKKYCYIERRLFDFISDKFDLYICMYEEEILDVEYLPATIELTEELIKNSDEEEFLEFAEEFLSLLKYALANNVIVGFYF